ncbi:hypothetical protein PybrP1_001302 [[Pythium] brassicae (nom. inval.)]|nr:hypothetical protein PybrP1_001302 [[Pythium] brassicae (nom. inval.)]
MGCVSNDPRRDSAQSVPPREQHSRCHGATPSHQGLPAYVHQPQCNAERADSRLGRYRTGHGGGLVPAGTDLRDERHALIGRPRAALPA